MRTAISSCGWKPNTVGDVAEVTERQQGQENADHAENV